MSIWDAPATTTRPTFVLYQTFHWKLLDENGQQIAASTESFLHSDEALADLEVLHREFPDALLAEEREVDPDA